MDNCGDCQRLAREVEILRRIDYRAAETKGQELIAHQLSCHFLHIAHAPDSRFSANAESGEQSQEI